MRRASLVALAGALAVSAFAGSALGAPLGDRTLYRTNDGPYWLTAGTDGTIWYTNDGAADVVAMDANGNVLRQVDAGARTFGIATAADGRVWFANQQGNDQGIGRLDADGGNYTFIPTGSTAALQAVAIGPDGNPWFTEWFGGGSIGTVRSGGTVVRFPVGSNAGYGLTAGPDGNVWFAELNRNNSGEYVRVTPSGDATRWPVDTGAADMATDAGGNLWLVSESGSTSHNIIKIDAAGQELARFNAPQPGLRQIALGPDGAMWFTMYEAGKIGRIDGNGAIQTWVADPANPTARPFDIVWGPDGDMWYTVADSGAIGRIGTGSTTAPPAPPGDAGGGSGSDAGGGSPAPATPAANGGCAVPPLGPVGFSINRGEDYTNSVDVTLDVIWPLCTTSVQLANDGGFRSAQSRGVAASIPWRLSTSGPERLPKTVYLRFGSSTQNFTDDIILDQAAPLVTSATARVAGQSANARRARSGAPRVVVTARARDRGASGPGVIEVRAGRKVVQARYGARATIRTGLRSVNVRVRDRAGNWSRARAVAVR